MLVISKKLKIKKFSNIERKNKYKYILYFLDNNNYNYLNKILIKSFDKFFFDEENFWDEMCLPYKFYVYNYEIFDHINLHYSNVDKLTTIFYKTNYGKMRNQKFFDFQKQNYYNFFNTILFHKLYRRILFSLSWGKYNVNLYDDFNKKSYINKIKNSFINPFGKHDSSNLKKFDDDVINKQQNNTNIIGKSLQKKKKLIDFISLEERLMNLDEEDAYDDSAEIDLNLEEQYSCFRKNFLLQISKKIILIRYLILNKFIRNLIRNGKRDKAISICFAFLRSIHNYNMKKFWLNNNVLRFKSWDKVVNLKNKIDSIGGKNKFNKILFTITKNKLLKYKYKDKLRKFKSYLNNKNNLNFKTKRIIWIRYNFFIFIKIKNYFQFFKKNKYREYIFNSFSFNPEGISSVNNTNNKFITTLDLFIKTIFFLSPYFRIIIKYIAGEKMSLPIPLYAHKRIFYGIKIFVDSARTKKKDKTNLLNSLLSEFFFLQDPLTYEKSTSYLKLKHIHSTAIAGRDQLKYL